MGDGPDRELVRVAYRRCPVPHEGRRRRASHRRGRACPVPDTTLMRRDPSNADTSRIRASARPSGAFGSPLRHPSAEFFESSGYRCRHVQWPVMERERQFAGMEEQTGVVLGGAPRVLDVAEDRVTAGCGVHADLMRPSSSRRSSARRHGIPSSTARRRPGLEPAAHRSPGHTSPRVSRPPAIPRASVPPPRDRNACVRLPRAVGRVAPRAYGGSWPPRGSPTCHDPGGEPARKVSTGRAGAGSR